MATARSIAAAANVEIGDDVWTDPKPQIPVGLEKNQAFVGVWYSTLNNNSLLNALIDQYAKEKLGVPLKR